jgi:hypothetical protein
MEPGSAECLTAFGIASRRLKTASQELRPVGIWTASLSSLDEDIYARVSRGSCHWNSIDLAWAVSGEVTTIASAFAPSRLRLPPDCVSQNT